MDAKRLAEALKSLDNQNFGPNDSILASTINHPVNAGGKFLDWLKNQVNTAAGIPDQYDNPNPLLAPSPDAQSQVAFDLAGMAQLGSMPFAPKSAGGTLGTLAKPAMAADGNLNEELISKYLREGQLSPQELAQYETNAVQMTDSGKHHYNLANANAQGGTPESRAVDLGFYTGNSFTQEMGKRDFNRSSGDGLEVFYHGGPDNWDYSGFKPATGNSFYNPENINGGYAFLTSSKGEAKGYADELKQKKGIKTNVHEFYVRPEEKTKVIPTSNGNKLPSYKDLQEKGFGQTLVDLGKYGKGNDDKYYRHEWILPYTPSQIRSTKAAFDPLRKDSANLLATRLLPATMLGYGMANQKPDNQSIAEALRGQ